MCRVELMFEEVAMKGVACDLNSPGFHALCKATEEVVGHVKPYSITGSLPCIRELQVRERRERRGGGRVGMGGPECGRLLSKFVRLF